MSEEAFKRLGKHTDGCKIVGAVTADVEQTAAAEAEAKAAVKDKAKVKSKGKKKTAKVAKLDPKADASSKAASAEGFDLDATKEQALGFEKDGEHSQALAKWEAIKEAKDKPGPTVYKHIKANVAVAEAAAAIEARDTTEAYEKIGYAESIFGETPTTANLSKQADALLDATEEE